MMSAEALSLIGPEDPAPCEIINGESETPVALVCEHAGRAIPATLGDLGLSDEVRARHIGWDIGAAAVTRRLAARLGATAILQPYSRLVVDCNRPPEAPDFIPEISDGTVVPGNRKTVHRAEREREIFDPFNAAVKEITDRPGLRLILSIHSFTRYLGGHDRPWDVGFLYRRDAATSGRLAALLSRQRPHMLIGMNQPYRIEDLSDWFVPRHGERTGLAHSLIEIRNDLIADTDGAAEYADLLAAIIEEFLAGDTGC